MPGCMASIVIRLIYSRFPERDSTSNKACMPAGFIMEHARRGSGEGVLYPNVHYLNRQVARERLAAKQALTEAARLRHLALAEHYERKAEAIRGSASA